MYLTSAEVHPSVSKLKLAIYILGCFLVAYLQHENTHKQNKNRDGFTVIACLKTVRKTNRSLLCSTWCKCVHLDPFSVICSTVLTPYNWSSFSLSISPVHLHSTSNVNSLDTRMMEPKLQILLGLSLKCQAKQALCGLIKRLSHLNLQALHPLVYLYKYKPKQLIPKPATVLRVD